MGRNRNEFGEKYFKQKKQEKIKSKLLKKGFGNYLIFPINDSIEEGFVACNSMTFQIHRTYITFKVINWDLMFPDDRVTSYIDNGLEVYVELKSIEPDTLRLNSPYIGEVLIDTSIREDDFF